jgi:anti-sigma factor RsiW
MTNGGHEEMSEIHALSGAYAVDALDDIERAQFERHLATCPACRSEVASLREAAAVLAETTVVAPPAGLRERVLAEVATVRPLPPSVPEGHRRSRRWFGPLLVAAAVVLAAGVGGVIWSQQDDEPSQVEQVLAAEDAERFTQTLPDGSTATVVRSVSENGAVLVTEGLADAPSGHDYALWLQQDGEMELAGIMPPGPDQEVLLEGDAATAEGAGISVEEAGTEPVAPSDEVVALFAFDSV